jgi:hypothetical protein
MQEARLIGQQIERRFCRVAADLDAALGDLEENHPTLACSYREPYPDRIGRWHELA